MENKEPLPRKRRKPGNPTGKGGFGDREGPANPTGKGGFGERPWDAGRPTFRDAIRKIANQITVDAEGNPVTRTEAVVIAQFNLAGDTDKIGSTNAAKFLAQHSEGTEIRHSLGALEVTDEMLARLTAKERTALVILINKMLSSASHAADDVDTDD